MRFIKLRKQFLTGLFLAGFFITTANAIWPWVVWSTMVHCTTLGCSFDETPSAGGSGGDSSSPIMQLKLPELTSEEAEKYNNPSLDPVSNATMTYSTGLNIYPNDHSLTGAVFETDYCDLIGSDMALYANNTWDNDTTFTTLSADLSTPGVLICEWTLDNNVIAPTYSYARYYFGETTACLDGYELSGDSTTCNLPAQPSDNLMNMARMPDGTIQQHPMDPDPVNPLLSCDENSCTRTVTNPDGSTTTSTISSDETGTTVENIQSNATVQTPEGQTDTGATVANYQYFDNAGEPISQTQTTTYSDNTSTTISNAGGTSTTTGTGTTRIDETGTPGTSGYANYDSTGLDDFISGAVTPQDSSTIPQPTTTFSLGGLGQCDNTGWNINYFGQSYNMDICQYVYYVRDILFWIFNILTFIYIYFSFTHLNRAS